MAHRAALVAAMGDTDEARAHRFFLALDRATHPGVKPSPADGDFAPLPLVDVLRLGGFLADRYEARARYAHTGAVLGKGELDGGNLLPLAEAAGELLLGLMQEHFGEDGTGPLSATADAFERFGVGELHLFESHGAPNGTHIFSFCELALYLVDQGAPGSPFSRLFPIFGRACELFAVTYHACGAPRTRCSYQIANNELGVRAPDPSFRSDLAALWAGGSARRRYDSLVHAALVNDFAGERDLPFWSRTMTLNDQGCGLNVLRSLQGATSSHRPIR